MNKEMIMEGVKLILQGIGEDVEQGYKNGYIFNTLWKRKEPTEADLQVKGYG